MATHNNKNKKQDFTPVIEQPVSVGYSTLTAGFAGFVGSTPQSEYTSQDNTGASNEPIDPQILYCLNRLKKRDSTTKLKALADLESIFYECDISMLKPCAAAWAQQFNIIALDNDRRIREALHKCFLPFCDKIRRNKATFFTIHLKRIFLNWWLHCHDTSNEVSKAAWQSFIGAFGNENKKHWKAIKYVKKEMIQQIASILDSSTNAENLGSIGVTVQKSTNKSKNKSKVDDSKKSAKKEANERYERLVASVLAGLSTLIDREWELQCEKQLKSEKKKKKEKEKDNESKEKDKEKEDGRKDVETQTPSPEKCKDNEKNTKDKHKDNPKNKKNKDKQKEKNKDKNKDKDKEKKKKKKSKDKSDDVWWFAEYNELLSNVDTWRFINHRSETIRNKAYNLVTSCLNCDDIAEGIILPLVGTKVFKCLSETYRPNYRSLWTALATMVFYQGCWEFTKKKSFLTRLSTLIKADVYTSASYIRSIFLKMPFNILFNDKINDSGVIKLFNAIWKGSMEISHINKRFQSVITMYFKCILQLLRDDMRNYECMQHQMQMQSGFTLDYNEIELKYKTVMIESIVIKLSVDSMIDHDCPQSYFEILADYFLPKLIIEPCQDKTPLAHEQREYFYDKCVLELIWKLKSGLSEMMTKIGNNMKQLMNDYGNMNSDDIEDLSQQISDDCRKYLDALTKVNPLIGRLKIFLESNLNKNRYECESGKYTLQELINQLMQDVWNFAKIVRVYPTSVINENEDESENDGDENNDNDSTTLLDFSLLDILQWDKLALDMCNESFDFVDSCIKSLAITPAVASNTDKETGIVGISDNDIDITATDQRFLEFLNDEIIPQIEFVLSECQTTLPIDSSSKLLQKLLQISQRILGTKLDVVGSDTQRIGQWDSFINSISIIMTANGIYWSMKSFATFINTIVLNNDETKLLFQKIQIKSLNQFVFDWFKLFLQTNDATSIGNPILDASTTVTRPLSAFKRPSAKIDENEIARNKTISHLSYTALTDTCQVLLGGSNKANKNDNQIVSIMPVYLCQILKMFGQYIEKSIEYFKNQRKLARNKNRNSSDNDGDSDNSDEDENDVDEIHVEKLHSILRCIEIFLAQNWAQIGNSKNNKDIFVNKAKIQQTLIILQFRLISKIFSLCFYCNVPTIQKLCEYIFKFIVKSKDCQAIYFDFLKFIARSIRLPWYFTDDPTNANKTVPVTYKLPANMLVLNNNNASDAAAFQISLDLNRDIPTRYEWCQMVCLLIESTGFEGGLKLMSIILDKQDMTNIFSMALNTDVNNEPKQSENNKKKLIDLGVSIITLQRCRDVVCDLCDLVGMDMILYQANSFWEKNEDTNTNENDSEIKKEHRLWLLCWLLAFEEKLSWLPLSTIPDPSIIEHRQSWQQAQKQKQSGMKGGIKGVNNNGLPTVTEAELDTIMNEKQIFAKPRQFSSVVRARLIEAQNNSSNSFAAPGQDEVEEKHNNSLVLGYFNVPQLIIDELVEFLIVRTDIVPDVQSSGRIVGFLVNIINERIGLFVTKNKHEINYDDTSDTLLQGLKQIIQNVWPDEDEDEDEDNGANDEKKEEEKEKKEKEHEVKIETENKNDNEDDDDVVTTTTTAERNRKEKVEQMKEQTPNELEMNVMNIELLACVFVMFPDLIPESFIWDVIDDCNDIVRNLVDIDANTVKSIQSLSLKQKYLQKVSILQQVYKLLTPIYGIALNLTNGYQAPLSYASTYHTVNNNNNASNIMIEDLRDISNYETSLIWASKREELVGSIFELFTYIYASFSKYLEKLSQNSDDDNNENPDYLDVEHSEALITGLGGYGESSKLIENNLEYCYCNVLVLMSHTMIGMNSEGTKDVYFDLNWNSLIYVTNFAINYVLHDCVSFTATIHSFLQEFYQFIILYSNSDGNINTNEMDTLYFLDRINNEYRSLMCTIWNSMGVLRQIAIRSTDLTGRKNLAPKSTKSKTGKNSSFIFESLELLIEILGNEMWRNILSSEALASPFHKLGIFELEVEELAYMESSHNNSMNNQLYSQMASTMFDNNFSMTSMSSIPEGSVGLGLQRSESLASTSTVNSKKSILNNRLWKHLNKKRNSGNSKFLNIIMPSYEIHAILDELYYSINDLMCHPIVISPSFEQRKLIAAMIASNKSGKKSLYNIDDLVFLNENLSDILTNWHYPLFDALSSVHHQIVAAALRILSVSTRWYTRKLLTRKDDTPDKEAVLPQTKAKTNSSEQKSNDDNNNNGKGGSDMNEAKLPYDSLYDSSDDEEEDTNENRNESSPSVSDALSIASNMSTQTSVSFAMSSKYNQHGYSSIYGRNSHTNHGHNHSSHISKKDRKRFRKIHQSLNQIIPVVYMLPHNSHSFIPTHQIRCWMLCWWLFMDVIEEVPLNLKLEIVNTMKHDDKNISPLGSYRYVFKEILEHIYVIYGSIHRSNISHSASSSSSSSSRSGSKHGSSSSSNSNSEDEDFEGGLLSQMFANYDRECEKYNSKQMLYNNRTHLKFFQFIWDLAGLLSFCVLNVVIVVLICVLLSLNF